MPALSVHQHDVGFTLDYFAPWQWACHTDNPAQYYGEPYPSPWWILQKSIELSEYRRAKAYTQADAIRQWLLDYGMIVEYEPLCVRVKW